MTLLDRTPNIAGHHPAVQERGHLQILRLREPSMVTVGLGPRLVVEEPSMVTRHRLDLGPLQERQEPTWFRHHPAPIAVSHVQFEDQTGSSAPGAHGQILQSEPRIRISGSTLTLASRSDFCERIERVQYASCCGSSTFGGGVLPKSR